ALLHALQNPRVNIAGIRRADLLPLLDQLSPDRLSRQLRRLRPRRNQAGRWNLSLLPHPHRPRRYRSALPGYSDRDHPGARINEKSVQEVSRVRSLETNPPPLAGEGRVGASGKGEGQMLSYSTPAVIISYAG